MRELLANLAGALDAGRDCVYCSVVETRGSTPQKAGAAMLVFADGSQAGTLGGGCVEAEVKRHALRTLADRGAGILPAEIGRQDAGPTDRAAQLHTFCLDDNYGWDDGLICGGRMSIIATPLSLAQRSYFDRLRSFVDSGTGCTEAVAVQPAQAGVPVGSRYLFDATGTLAAQLGPAPPVAL